MPTAGANCGAEAGRAAERRDPSGAYLTAKGVTGMQQYRDRGIDKLFDGIFKLADNPTKPVTANDIAQTRRDIRELTKVGEREIHEVVLSCARARRQLLNSVPTTKPIRH